MGAPCDLSFAIICSSNMNRSMEAHDVLANKGFNVKSFGTSERVKLPGPSIDRPNCYEFGVPYDNMYKDLLKKDKKLYTKNGVLYMLKRNRKIKICPERFQDSKYIFDVIFTCEERVFDIVVEWFNSRRSVHNHPVHIINLEIRDNHEEAIIAAYEICDLVTKMSQAEDLDCELDKILQNYEASSHRPFLNCIMFY